MIKYIIAVYSKLLQNFDIIQTKQNKSRILWDVMGSSTESYIIVEYCRI